jgi:hypothetical protein
MSGVRYTLTVSGRCDGHAAGPFDPMGETVFCDGSCSFTDFAFGNTERVARTAAYGLAASYRSEGYTVEVRRG